MYVFLCVCVWAGGASDHKVVCVCVCVCARARACVHVCVFMGGRGGVSDHKVAVEDVGGARGRAAIDAEDVEQVVELRRVRETRIRETRIRLRGC